MVVTIITGCMTTAQQHVGSGCLCMKKMQVWLVFQVIWRLMIVTSVAHVRVPLAILNSTTRHTCQSHHKPCPRHHAAPELRKTIHPVVDIRVDTSPKTVLFPSSVFCKSCRIFSLLSGVFVCVCKILNVRVICAKVPVLSNSLMMCL